MTAAVVLKKECRDQPLEKVVVFNDRAELVRKVEFELQAGINEVHLENVTGNVIYDSVRVDGRGDGVIHDVQLTERAAVHEETDSPKVAEIRSRHEAKQKQLNELRDRQSVLKRRIDVLDKVVEGAGESVVRPPKTSGESFVLSQDTLENLTNFYNFYEESSTSVRSQLRGVNAEVEKAERELSAIQDELNRAESDSYEQRFSKSIVVTLESEKGGLVELKVSYQVHGARWHPTYDLRVCTTGEKSLKHYLLWL
ncbi:unnamed protein product [Nippostrongylus brasiliensis]|uniref:DUF4140 domain-containing protein n=1 Tax=Nippostrongylus brasiliensis TaxID=27835 RepID=A0A0N4YNR7_NIPBR|nr:unnamed protein product [Nippostrongylus brasiliensis]